MINKAKLMKDVASKNPTNRYGYVGGIDPMLGNYFFRLLFAPSSTPAKSWKDN